MKTREEIEKYLNDLGIEIKSYVRNIPYNENGILTFYGLKNNGNKDPQKKYFTLKTINEEAETALINLINKSIVEGDMETAVAAIDVLEQKSDRYKINRNSAVKGVPLNKKIEFFRYCDENKIYEENKEDLATYTSVKQRKEKERDDEER